MKPRDLTSKISKIELLGKVETVEIDRPLGFIHKNKIEYMINYGFIPGTVAEDNEESDVYIIGYDHVLSMKERVQVKIIAVVERYEGDIETKFVGKMLDDKNIYSSREIENAIKFQEKYHKHRLYL